MPSNFCRQINYPALGRLIQKQAEAPHSSKLTITIPALLDSSDCDRLATLNADGSQASQPAILKRLIWELNSAGVLQRLEKLSHIQFLIPDSGPRNSVLMTAQQAAQSLQQQPKCHPETGLNWGSSLLLVISGTILLPLATQDQGISLQPGDACLISSDQVKTLIPNSTENSRVLVTHYYLTPDN